MTPTHALPSASLSSTVLLVTSFATPVPNESAYRALLPSQKHHFAMKLLFVLVSVLVVRPLMAADAQPFGLTSLQLELPRQAIAPFSAVGFRLDLPINPVRIDYGLPIESDGVREEVHKWRNLDAPGPGYENQKTNNLSNDRSA